MTVEEARGAAMASDLTSEAVGLQMATSEQPDAHVVEESIGTVAPAGSTSDQDGPLVKNLSSSSLSTLSAKASEFVPQSLLRAPPDKVQPQTQGSSTGPTRPAVVADPYTSSASPHPQIMGFPRPVEMLHPQFANQSMPRGMIQLGVQQMPFNQNMPRGMSTPVSARVMSAPSAPPQHVPPGAPTGPVNGAVQDQQSVGDKTLNPPKKNAPPPLDADVAADIRARMMTQVEFYMSDQNLPTDIFLMKQVKSDPEGFVPLAVIASFRKIKSLLPKGQPPRMLTTLLAEALTESSQVVLSEDRKKVRRAEDLPDVNLAEVQSRSVVAENLPPDHSIEAMEAFFASVGVVKMVRVKQPQSGGNSYQMNRKDQPLCTKVHAIVEYETRKEAEKAVAELSDERNWRSGLRVRLLGGRANADNPVGDGESKEGKPQGRPILSAGRGRGLPKSRQNRQGSEIGTPPKPIREAIQKPPPGPRMPDGTKGFAAGRGKKIASDLGVVVVSGVIGEVKEGVGV